MAKLLLVSMLLGGSACGKEEEPVPASGRSVAAADRGLAFSTDWVSPHEGTWRRALEPIVGEPNLNYLEIGVWEGRSFIWMLDHVLTHPTARATAIDPFFGDPKHERTYRANLRKSGHESRVTTWVGTSEVMLRQLPLDAFDLIYIDGSHKATHVFMDAGMTWPLLKEGGYLIFDDYTWDAFVGAGRRAPDDLIPRAMIDAFVTANRDSLKLIHKGFQLILQRVDNPCSAYPDCTPIGDYRYHWRDRRLKSQATDAEVELSAEEQAAVEAFLLSRGPGELGFDFARASAESPIFRSLLERLGRIR